MIVSYAAYEHQIHTHIVCIFTLYICRGCPRQAKRECSKDISQCSLVIPFDRDILCEGQSP